MDLQRFCHEYRGKGSLSTPFSRGDYTYATDGRMIVRVPRLKDMPERDNAPKADHLGWNHSELSDWTNPPKIDLSGTEKCSLCKGSGKATVCPECDGEGEVVAETAMNEYEVTCKTCEGDGATAGGKDMCSSCDGTGLYIDNPVKYGSRYIGGLLLAKMSILPDLQFSHYGGIEDAVRFIFDGGEGLVMPFRV